jgi:hypothetical protein
MPPSTVARMSTDTETSAVQATNRRCYWLSLSLAVHFEIVAENDQAAVQVAVTVVDVGAR